MCVYSRSSNNHPTLLYIYGDVVMVVKTGDPDDLYLIRKMGSYWSKKKDHGQGDVDEPDAARKTTQWQVVRLKREVRIQDLPEDVRSMFIIRRTGSVLYVSE